jgi:hypothetical protein
MWPNLSKITDARTHEVPREMLYLVGCPLSILTHTLSTSHPGSPSTASQLNIVSGQLVQYLTSGSSLYAQVATAAANTTRLKVFWSTSAATNVTWSFNGDGVNGVVAGATQQNTGAFLACNDVSADVPNVYLNMGAYDYMTPAGCADEVRIIE